jgi:cytochrome c551/c552
MIPASAEHRAITTEKECAHCHQIDGVKPVPARHPKRQDCFRCHARAST